MTQTAAIENLHDHRGFAVQYAALPYRFAPGLEILLVTSRDTGRWVLPKGWPMKGKSPAFAAAREALEEAGVVGKIAGLPIGAYCYAKQLKAKPALDCVVEVYPLLVEQQRKRWPEQHQRRSQWFTPLAAAEVVQEGELAALLAGFSPDLAQDPI